MKKRLVILSGPSCVGKGPTLRALDRSFPTVRQRSGKVVLHTSRKARPGEINGVHYHFSEAVTIRNFDPGRFVVVDVRTDVQAMDMQEVAQELENHELIFAEVFPTLAIALRQWSTTQNRSNIEIVRVAMLPLSNDELQHRVQTELKPASQIVYEEMRQKLVNRKARLNPNDKLDDIEKRAQRAFEECQMMIGYEHHIVNHVGEDQVHLWEDPLLRDAENTMRQMAAILDPNLKWHEFNYGPIHHGPGPGDDSDANIGCSLFFGTTVDCLALANAEANRLTDESRQIGFSHTEKLLTLIPWAGYADIAEQP